MISVIRTAWVLLILISQLMFSKCFLIHALMSLITVDWKLRLSSYLLEVVNVLRTFEPMNLLNIWLWILEFEGVASQYP